jgi:hypothetical protein
MSTKRRRRQQRRELTLDQEMELLCGPGATTPDGRVVSDFESPFVRRAAWYEHKADLMEDNPPGMRPWAFWEYEVGHQPADVGMEGQARELRRLGLLSDEEKGLLWAMKGAGK